VTIGDNARRHTTGDETAGEGLSWLWDRAKQWAAGEANAARYGFEGFGQLTWSDVGSGIETGFLATGNQLTFGGTGLFGNDLDPTWWSKQTQNPGYWESRRLAGTGQAAAAAAVGAWAFGQAAESLSWSEGVMKPGILGTTDPATAQITVDYRLSGDALSETVKHEQFHSLIVRLVPSGLKELRAGLYSLKGTATLVEEFGAEWYATGSAGRALSILPSYANPFTLAAEAVLAAKGLDMAGQWARDRSASGSGPASGSEVFSPPAGGWTGGSGSLPLSAPATPPYEPLTPGFQPVGGGPTHGGTATASLIPPPPAADSVRNRFASRLSGASWDAFTSTFTISGVQVQLMEGSSLAWVGDRAVFLDQPAQRRNGEMSLTRGAADQIERTLRLKPPATPLADLSSRPSTVPDLGFTPLF
jgi:hypothetical protein